MRLNGGEYLLDLDPFREVLIDENATFDDLKPCIEYIKGHLPIGTLKKQIIVKFIEKYYTSPIIFVQASATNIAIDLNVAKFDDKGAVDEQLILTLDVNFNSETIVGHTYFEV